MKRDVWHYFHEGKIILGESVRICGREFDEHRGDRLAERLVPRVETAFAREVLQEANHWEHEDHKRALASLGSAVVQTHQRAEEGRLDDNRRIAVDELG